MYNSIYRNADYLWFFKGDMWMVYKNIDCFKSVHVLQECYIFAASIVWNLQFCINWQLLTTYFVALALKFAAYIHTFTHG